MTAAEVSTLLQVWATFRGVFWSGGAGAKLRGEAGF